jgi:hypothetical protein
MSRYLSYLYNTDLTLLSAPCPVQPLQAPALKLLMPFLTGVPCPWRFLHASPRLACMFYKVYCKTIYHSDVYNSRDNPKARRSTRRAQYALSAGRYVLHRAPWTEEEMRQNCGAMPCLSLVLGLHLCVPNFRVFHERRAARGTDWGTM